MIEKNKIKKVFIILLLLSGSFVGTKIIEKNVHNFVDERLQETQIISGGRSWTDSELFDRFKTFTIQASQLTSITNLVYTDAINFFSADQNIAGDLNVSKKIRMNNNLVVTEADFPLGDANISDFNSSKLVFDSNGVLNQLALTQSRLNYHTDTAQIDANINTYVNTADYNSIFARRNLDENFSALQAGRFFGGSFWQAVGTLKNFFNGKVGIKMIPSQELSVAGNIQATGRLLSNLINENSPGKDYNIGFQNAGSTGSINFTTKNLPRMTITSDGKVGIGMTPTKLLEVNGNAGILGALTIGNIGTISTDGIDNSMAFRNDGAFYIADSANANKYLTVKANGDVIIGGATIPITTGLSEPLMVVAPNSNYGAAISGVADSSSRAFYFYTQDFNNVDTGGRIGANITDGYGSIQVVKNGGSNYGNLALQPNGGTVSIGKTSSSGNFDVKFNGGTANFGDVGGGNNIIWTRSSGGSAGLWAGGNTGVVSTGKIDFIPNQTYADENWEIKMRLTESGNLGVKTTNPLTDLHVKGSTGVRIEGTGTNTDTIDLTPGTAATFDRLDYRAVNTNRGTSFQLTPNGTSQKTKIALTNQDDTDNFGSMYMETDGAQAYISPQDVGAPTTSTSNISIGGGDGGDWNAAVIKAQKFGVGLDFPASFFHAKGNNPIFEITNIGGALQIRRASASGRSQMSLQDESGTEEWRYGMTGAGSTDFAFYDQTQNTMVMEKNGNVYFTPSGNLLVGKNTSNGSSKMQLAGDLNVEGSIYYDGALTNYSPLILVSAGADFNAYDIMGTSDTSTVCWKADNGVWVKEYLHYDNITQQYLKKYVPNDPECTGKITKIDERKRKKKKKKIKPIA